MITRIELLKILYYRWNENVKGESYKFLYYRRNENVKINFKK